MATITQFVLPDKSKSIFNLKNKSCPNCGHHLLNRIKRKNHHKLLSIIFFGGPNLKRYNCDKCEWKGLKLDATPISYN